jgi:hypothetical protein
MPKSLAAKFSISISMVMPLITALLFTQVSIDSSLAQSQASALYVQVKLTKLRVEPKQWGKAIKDLNYGQSLILLEEQGAWIKVELESSEQGYIHASAVSGRKILVGATTQALLSSSADDPDVYLAGKGFSQLAVDAYRKDLKAAPVDLSKMKGQSELGEEGLRQFVQKGKLKDV